MLPGNIAQFPMHFSSLQNTQLCYINTMLVNNVKQLHKQLQNATLKQRVQIAYTNRHNPALNLTHKQALNCVKALVQKIKEQQ